MPIVLDVNGNPVEPYFVETYESRKMDRKGDGTTTGKVYGKVVGTEDEVVAGALVEQELPVAWFTPAFPLKFADYEMEHLGGGVWAVVATYIGDLPSYTFDTTGGTKHITQSRQTMAAYSAFQGVPPPDFKGAIGVTFDSVEGCDVVIPIYKFTETHKMDLALVTQTYLRNVFNLTGRTNLFPFRWFSAGEVLFLGGRGSQRGISELEVTYEFAASPNIDPTNPDNVPLQIGDILVDDKGGWEYLWVRYVDLADRNANVKVKRPVSAHVERVYESGDFAALFPDGLVPQLPVEPAP